MFKIMSFPLQMADEITGLLLTKGDRVSGFMCALFAILGALGMYFLFIPGLAMLVVTVLTWSFGHVLISVDNSKSPPRSMIWFPASLLFGSSSMGLFLIVAELISRLVT